MQNVTIIGKIIRQWDSEKVSYITIACKEGRDNIEFIPVTVFQTEFLKKHFHKGKWIGVKAHIHVNKRGNEYITEIISDDLYFVGDKTAEVPESFESMPADLTGVKLPWEP